MAVNMVFPTIVLAVTGGNEEGSEGAGAPPKDESTLRRFLKNQSKNSTSIEKTCRQSHSWVKESAVGVILSFLIMMSRIRS